MKDSILAEYEMLKSEINQIIELVNSLTTFTLTTVVAILTFALTSDNAMLYLLPYCIIIPMYLRISYYRSAMVKILAYMIIFLEKYDDGINWETRNSCLMNRINKKEAGIVLRAKYYEGLVASIICYILFFDAYIKQEKNIIILVVCLLVPIFLIIWIWCIVRHINDIESEKREWIKEWKKINNH